MSGTYHCTRQHETAGHTVEVTVTARGRDTWIVLGVPVPSNICVICREPAACAYTCERHERAWCLYYERMAPGLFGEWIAQTVEVWRYCPLLPMCTVYRETPSYR